MCKPAEKAAVKTMKLWEQSVGGYGKAVKGWEETAEKAEREKCGRKRKNVRLGTVARQRDYCSKCERQGHNLFYLDNTAQVRGVLRGTLRDRKSVV